VCVLCFYVVKGVWCPRRKRQESKLYCNTVLCVRPKRW